MKAKIKLSTPEKIAFGGVVVSGIVLGVVPTIIIGGLGYYFKDDAENFLVKKGLITREEGLISKFKNLWKD